MNESNPFSCVLCREFAFTTEFLLTVNAPVRASLRLQLFGLAFIYYLLAFCRWEAEPFLAAFGFRFEDVLPRP